MAELTKYAVARHFYLVMVKRAVVDFAVSADWTPAAGDVKISIDGGAAANVTNLPTAIAMGNTAIWDFSMTSGEMTGKQMVITVADAATKVVEDQSLRIETYGNASAQHAFDLNTATVVASSVTAVGSGAITSTSFGAGAINAAAIAADTGLKIRSGTAQAGAASTITLDSGASATDSIYVGDVVVVTGGTGAGQHRIVTTYVGSTKVATVGEAWQTNPDNTSTFMLLPGRAFVSTVLAAAITAIQSGLATSTALATAQTSLNTIAGYVDTEVADIVTRVTDLQARTPAALVSGRMDVSVGAMAADTLTAAAVATDALGALELAAGAASEIAAAVWAQAMSELSGVPAPTDSVLAGLEWLVALSRNLRVQAATTETVYKDDGTTVLATSAKTDVAGTFNRGEYS